MRRIYFALLVILIVAALLRIPLVYQGFFAFTYDQGRDLLAVRQIIDTHKIPLIGPTTGLPGIFYGPWWYFFLLLPFLLTSGNPILITLVFSLIGIITVLLSFILIRRITNDLIALGISFIIAMSQAFITASSQIWSPSLVLPIMLTYLFSLIKIFNKPSKRWFIILGISLGLIGDTEAAFGAILTISTIISFLFFKKDFFKKETLYFFIGLLFVFLPRVFFELRHDFLITRSVLDWLNHPKVYQEKLNVLQRLTARADVFYLNLAQTFSHSNKLFATLPPVTILSSIITSKSRIFKDKLFRFLMLNLLFIFLGFTVFPDAIWDYYLVGLPLIYISLFAISLKYLFATKRNVVLIILVLSVFTSYHKKIVSPFSLNWEGDGAIFKNQKTVMDYLKNELKGDYSLYVYTPARFDYPFDYLTIWYHSRNLIDLPKERQKKMFLIIRDDNSHLYLPSGWYGDKTRDNTKVLERKTFPGDLIVEKHIAND